ncbi:maleate cis-trans isomerase family protein [Acuticoccus kandeliae]|uniref:maleate cis-trans isomerase family protein n=1 Tax=Acuticoccus kandeliae TaxID=2073160 RepID=UPI000D3E491C|nr:hypothetical protein [Acuticoccus kandeliae]
MTNHPGTPKRIGLLIPSSNTTIESEFYRFGPEGFTWHFARLPMTEVTQQGFESQNAAIDAACGLLSDAHPDGVVLCQSAASFIGGSAYDEAVRARIASAAGAPGFPAGAVMAEAVQRLGATRVALAVPFAGAVMDAGARYLATFGIEVVGVASLGMTDNFSIAALADDVIVDLAIRAAVPEAELIMLPGGNMRCLPLVETIERETGRPVVTTNQSVICALARHFGVALPPDKFGRLART